NPIAIAYAFIATHNHFVISGGHLVFGRTAPLVRLTRRDTEAHLGMLGILNSSAACFWLKQVCYPKGGDQAGTDGARVRKTLWDVFYNLNAAPLLRLPLPQSCPTRLARELVRLGEEYINTEPSRYVEKPVLSKTELTQLADQRVRVLAQM